MKAKQKILRFLSNGLIVRNQNSQALLTLTVELTEIWNSRNGKGASPMIAKMKST
jgi:hypothetical protein